MIKKAPFSFGFVLSEEKITRPVVTAIQEGNNPIVCCYCGSVIFKKKCDFCPCCGVKFKFYKSSADFPKEDPVSEQISFNI